MTLKWRLKMFSVREMLKKNNIDLKISDEALDLEFEGNFVFSHRSKEAKFIFDGPKEYVECYVFYDDNPEIDREIKIVPDDPDYVVRHHIHGGIGVCFCEMFNSEGQTSLIT